MNVGSIRNFGQNLSLQPTAYYEPLDEADVLSILNRHRGESIRAIGRLHSWSEAPVGEGVVLNLKHLQQVEVLSDATSVVLGGGCQIKTILDRLKQQDLTLPSLGLITEQTIAGAISTGTHGSGRHSLSHYVVAVRVARYDAATGTAIVEQIDGGAALQAARCSLGCLGIILSVTMKCRPVYSIEEHFREYWTVEEVLNAEDQFPLQQFFFIPWRWSFMAQHRREVTTRRSRFAWLYRIYWHLSIDWALHLLILTTLRLMGSFRPMRFLYRRVIPFTVIRNLKVTDDSAAMLVMEHELFRHMETELFVTREQLPTALEYLRNVLTVAGTGKPISQVELHDVEPKQLEALKGTYGHHYPLCVRKVLADDTLISMAADGQDRYAISLITYAKPSDRQGFIQVMEFLARTMSRQFGARPHWGKFCPLSPEELVAVYPGFPEFKMVCDSRDPEGVFRNRWINTLFSSAEAR